MTALSEMLLGSMWTRELSAEQRQRVITDATERYVDVGAYVCRVGESVDYWFGVIDGLLKVSIMSATGRLMTLTGVTEGGWFGEGSMLKAERRRYDAIALRPTHVACIPRATFKWLCEVSIPFNHFLVNQIKERCGQFIAMLQADRLFDRDARVAHCPWVLSNPQLYPGFGAHIDISQEETGHLAGFPGSRRTRRCTRWSSAGCYAWTTGESQCWICLAWGTSARKSAGTLAAYGE